MAAPAVGDGPIRAGGDFTTEGPNPRAGLAALDPRTGALAGFRRSPDSANVCALAASGSTLHAGARRSMAFRIVR